jgi:hypothetical protein
MSVTWFLSVESLSVLDVPGGKFGRRRSVEVELVASGGRDAADGAAARRLWVLDRHVRADAAVDGAGAALHRLRDLRLGSGTIHGLRRIPMGTHRPVDWACAYQRAWA